MRKKACIQIIVFNHILYHIKHCTCRKHWILSVLTKGLNKAMIDFLTNKGSLTNVGSIPTAFLSILSFSLQDKYIYYDAFSTTFYILKISILSTFDQKEIRYAFSQKLEKLYASVTGSATAHCLEQLVCRRERKLKLHNLHKKHVPDLILCCFLLF